ncbi:phage tail sheath C-terminal domain-containing protein [Lysobacter antibioticus]|uniref:phage tail sheath C-terminal domain-containing protein n=1 Tax=Lysobacter antibioticus TaxID=84531 RepID=UPI000347D2DA|nr:phage tail sheath C-terminal domain-containing protein [Lysobacter antibioticus]
MPYKTPGVHVEEISTLAPSVVAVETAVPVFIGYSERAQSAAGEDLRFVPTRIRSLLDYQQSYGGEYTPAAYRVVVDTAAGNLVGAVSPRNAADVERRYYLATALRHFYANGGGPCYVVSVGSYADAPALGNTTTPAGLLGGLSRVEAVDDPTLLVFPDGVSLSAAEMGSLQVAALAQCEKLQDRFVIMDLVQGDQPVSLALDPVGNFRQNVGTSSLRYGAAYYPWVRTIYRPDVDFRQLNLVTPALAAIPAGTINTLTGDTTIDGLVTATRSADTAATTVVGTVNVSAMAGPNPLTLTRANFGQLSQHYARLLDLLRQTDAATAAATVRQRFANLVLLVRAVALALRALQTAAPSLPASVNLAVTDLSNDSELAAGISALIAYEKNADVMGSISGTRGIAEVEGDYAALNGSPWIAPNANAGAIAASADAFGGATVRATALNAASALRGLFERPAAAVLAIFASVEFLADEAQNRLFERHPVFANILEQVNGVMTLQPPSGAVAGVYSAVDRTRGVWKAPANVSVADISGVAVKINDKAQEDLNVTSTGKSINAIRTFTGKGSLVWGARTLAGNDNEWRYVPVRRFFNMAEESIKKATEVFVFEPNDRGTWVRVRAMVENFLTVQWRQGALAGSVPQKAFFVKIGLGETMTAQDILEGRMIVEVGMAVVRPAEFIVLRFAHKMQTS